MKRVILASASPRRRELLSQAGIRFTAIPALGEEIITETKAALVVKTLSMQKATEVRTRILAGECPSILADKGKPPVVIGADTVVALDGQILGKPKDADDAKRMLALLQGRTHHVCTGVTVLFGEGQASACQKICFSSCTEVEMYPMDAVQIAAYVQTGEPMDKAGAYAIQGGCMVYVKAIRGDYNNVVGLPVAQLYQECLRAGIDLRRTE